MKDIFFFEFRGALLGIPAYSVDLAVDRLDFCFGFYRSLPSYKLLAVWFSSSDHLEFVDSAARKRFCYLVDAVDLLPKR